MARTGPVTKDTSTIAIGMAQIRIGVSATYIDKVHAQLAAADSIGALADTRFRGDTEWFRLESGFRLIEDLATPIKEMAALECTFREITPHNLAMAYGLDPSSLTTVHSGEMALGGRTSPVYLRMEALYTYPNGTNTMTIIFPRAQVTSNAEMSFASSDAAGVAVTFESKNASSDVTGGNAVWDNKPLGRIAWA